MQGIGPASPAPWPRSPSPESPRGPAESEKAARPEVEGAPSRAATEPGTSGLLALDAAPEGVDPELWSLLTTEERAHFSRFAAMGGVTYAPGTARPTRPPVSGQRLDLKV